MVVVYVFVLELALSFIRFSSPLFLLPDVIV